jgi:hypothetical protein
VPEPNEELRAELLTMCESDQENRRPPLRTDQAFLRQAAADDDARALRLAELVERHGWPGCSLAGADGATAAWLIAQHADRDPGLQERMLALLERAVASGEAPVSQLAFLTDRVCVNRGRAQVYGTQFGGHAATYGPRPIADPAGLDARRAEAGLEPFAEYERHMRALDAAERTP